MTYEPTSESSIRILAPHVLCVDDDERVLRVLRRTLAGQFCVDTATSGPQALELLARKSYAVLLSDLRMPGMSGAELLNEARRLTPHTTRLLLTGQADFDAAVSAANEGKVFRFLLKPYQPEELIEYVTQSARYHELQTAEAELLGTTLGDTVAMLTELMGLVWVDAPARALRARRMVRRLAELAELRAAWHVELAAVVTLLARITMGREAFLELSLPAELRLAECKVLSCCLETAERLLKPIPRLEPVRELLLAARDAGRSDGARVASNRADQAILLLILDLMLLTERSGDESAALRELAEQGVGFEPSWLEALAELSDPGPSGLEFQATVQELESGMRLASDVVATGSGQVLLHKGSELTRATLERIRNYARRGGVVEPVSVVRSCPPEIDLAAG